MIKIFLFFLLPLSLFGSKILSYNIYDRTDRVDVMLTFDTPYDGAIKKSIDNSKIIIKLEETSIESSKLKHLSSEFINTLSIAPMSSYVQITATVPPNIALIASKTSDAYGLRLRFAKKAISSTTKKVEQVNLKSPSLLSALPTKKDEDISQSYYIVIGILIVGILILILLKNKISSLPLNNQQQKNENSWLLGKEKKVKSEDNNTTVTLRFQKAIDEKNSVVMLDFAEQSYLVMMGTNNVLLDRFTDNKPSSQEDFESILQDRHQALEEFLDKPEVEPMEAYRNKASSISYEV